MSESLIPSSTTVTLDGKPYVIRFRALAFIKYAGECGGDLLNDVRRIGNELVAAGKMEGLSGIAAPLGTMRDILWAGLVDAQPNLQRDDVARMFSFREMEPIMTAITEALRLTMPELDVKTVRPTGNQSLSHLPSGRDSGHSSESEPALVPTISNS